MATTTKWPTKCGQCGRRVDKSKPWVVGHIKSRAQHPELTWDPTNWRIEHRRCSNRSGQAEVIAKAKAEALREAGVAPSEVVTAPPLQNSLPVATATTDTDSASSASRDAGVAVSFPLQDSLQKPPPLPVSLSPAQTANDALRWSSHDLRAYPWLEELAEVPEDSAPPLYMTPVPADAVCSYGWHGCTHTPPDAQAVPWIESEQQIELRWWQKLSLIRQLEHRADGSLCFRKKIESAPRRAGKSVGLRGGALWRMAVGPSLWGEVQNVIHTGSDVQICREIQRGAWQWAESRGWTVGRANGKESVETDSARWLVRAQDAVYGYDVQLGLGDECWNVKPDTISEGLEPATLERVSPQVILTSTAHRRATSLMRTELANAYVQTDADVLLVLWGAEPDCDPGDRAVWRAASPYWSADREKMIAGKYAAACAGEMDPEFDDPDPMRGFMAQYLNVWTIAEKRLVGKPVIEEPAWNRLQVVTPDRVDAVAVESWFEAGVSVATATRGEDGKVTVSAHDFGTLEQAAAYVAGLQVKRSVLVGSSLVSHPVWKQLRVRVEPESGATRTQVGELLRMLRDQTLLHDGSELLSRQVLDLRTSPGVDGPRIRSAERADAIKAAVWAAQKAATVIHRRGAIPSRYAKAS